MLFRQRFGGLSPALGQHGHRRRRRRPDRLRLLLADPHRRRRRRPHGSPRCRAGSRPPPTSAAASRPPTWPTSSPRSPAAGPASTVPGFAQEQQVRLRALAHGRRLGPSGPRGQRRRRRAAARRSAYTVARRRRHRRGPAPRRTRSTTPATSTSSAAPSPPPSAARSTRSSSTDGKTRTIIAVAARASPPTTSSIKLLGPGGELLDLRRPRDQPRGRDLHGRARSRPARTRSRSAPSTARPSRSPSGRTPRSWRPATSGCAGAGDATTGPRWRYFTANPSLDVPRRPRPRPTRSSAAGVRGTGCTTPTGPLRNVAATRPVGHARQPAVPTLTTVGNNANTHEAWASPLTPGGLLQAPVSPTRELHRPSSPTPGTTSGATRPSWCPGGNDIDARSRNLFVVPQPDARLRLLPGLHRAELQPPARQRRPRRRRRRPGGRQRPGRRGHRRRPSYLGRDNANQITLQDGIPGITNQYLFQPIAGAFYCPCTDGGLDMSIVGHEYTHAITNRMVGGPDEGLTSEQGGAMGESWGDLVAAEYLFSHGYSNGANPWAVGPYATGNAAAGIRDYAINKNPLNYSDYGFDTHRRRGARRRRDLERHHVGGPPGAGRRSGTASSRTPTRQLQLRVRAARPATQSAAAGHAVPRQPPLDPADLRLVPAPAGRHLDAGRPRRDDRRRPDALRRRRPDDPVGGVRPARHGRQGASTPTPTPPTRRRASPRPRAERQAVTFTVRRQGQGLRRSLRGPGHPGRRHRSPATELGASAKFTPGTYRMLYVSPDPGFRRFTLTVERRRSDQTVADRRHRRQPRRAPRPAPR